MASLDARFIDRSTEDEAVVTVRMRSPHCTVAQLEASLSVTYPYPTYFRLDRQPTLALAFLTTREG